MGGGWWVGLGGRQGRGEVEGVVEEGGGLMLGIGHRTPCMSYRHNFPV